MKCDLCKCLPAMAAINAEKQLEFSMGSKVFVSFLLKLVFYKSTYKVLVKNM